MIIGIDIDDVLSDFVTPMVSFYNKNYHSNITWGDLRGKSYLSFLGDTKEEAAEKLHLYNEEMGPSNQVPYKAAITAIKKLSKTNVLYAVTSRPFYIKEGTEAWINEYFPGMFKEVIFNNKNTKDKYLPQSGEPKHVVLKRIKADYFIEDLLKYALECPKDINVLLMDKPWNHGNLPDNIRRVKNWSEITKIIK